jgi:hypothetical protein
VTDEQFENEQRYQSVIVTARVMLGRGLITDDELRVIDSIMLEKYHPLLGGLYSDKTPKNLDFTAFQSDR